MSIYQPCVSEREMAKVIWAACLKVIAAHDPEVIAPKLGVKPFGLENMILRGTNSYNGLSLIEVVRAAEALGIDPIRVLLGGEG